MTEADAYGTKAVVTVLETLHHDLIKTWEAVVYPDDDVPPTFNLYVTRIGNASSKGISSSWDDVVGTTLSQDDVPDYVIEEMETAVDL